MTNLEKKSKSIKPAAAVTKKSRLSFFSDSVSELRKVHWPSRQEAFRLSMLVLIVCLILGVILGGIDYGFTNLFASLLLGG